MPSPFHSRSELIVSRRSVRENRRSTFRFNTRMTADARSRCVRVLALKARGAQR
jgi:hypothetical protein